MKIAADKEFAVRLQRRSENGCGVSIPSERRRVKPAINTSIAVQPDDVTARSAIERVEHSKDNWPVVRLNKYPENTKAVCRCSGIKCAVETSVRVQPRHPRNRIIIEQIERTLDNDLPCVRPNALTRRIKNESVLLPQT